MTGTVADLLSAPPPSAPAPAASPSVAPLPSGFVMEQDSPAPPPPGFVVQSAPADSGLWANIAQGASEGVQNSGALIRDALINPRGVYDRAAGMAAQVFGEKAAPSAPGLGALASIPADAAARKQSERVVAANPAERILRATAAGASGGVINPESVGMTVAQMLAGAASGAGAGAAAEVAPDNLKPLAATIGGLVAPVAGAGAHAVAGAAGRAAAPFAAGLSEDAAATAAGRTIAARATDPAAAAAALEQPAELVPGSQPTTFQQTGDPGLGALEREAATRNQPAFQQRAGEQNAARTQALGSIQQGADPNDVAATLRQHFDDLDQSHDQAVNDAAKAAQEKAAQFGGALPPDQYGQMIRDAMHTGERGAAAHVGSFYDAIDPEGNLTGNLKTTREGAQQIAEKVGPTAMPMSAEEADIFDKAASLPDLGPAQDLIELRKYLNAVARKPEVAGTPTSARLTQLRGVIDDNLANTISQQIANEAPAIARGQLDPSQSIAAKVKSQVDAWRAQRDAALARGDGSATAPDGGRAVAVPGLPGADGQTGEVASSGVGRSAASPGTPTFDEAARQRLTAANQAARGKAQVWGPKAIEAVLAKDGNGNFKVPDGKVAEAFFHPGASGFQHMQQALTASPESLPALVDHAATVLRRAAMNEDGTLDPAKYQRWKSAYADALRALPEDAKAKLADAASATETLTDARAARTAALKEAQAGAIGRVMKLTEPEDVTKAVGSILTGRTAVADMKQLALATRGDPEARAGLRQAVANYMTSKLIGNTEVGTSGVTAIKGDAYQTFLKNARPALHLIFTPEEVRTMEAIGDDIQRSNRSINSKPAGTPGTAHDVLAGLKKVAGHGGKSMLDVAGAILGEHLGGPVAAMTGLVGTHLLQSLHGAGVARIDALVSEAMLNPKLAAELLKKAPPKLTDASLRPLTIALVRAVPATSAAQSATNH